MSEFKSHYREDSPILLTAEHATGRIPDDYKSLGLSQYQLAHSEGDVFDFGSKELLLYMSEKLRSSYLWANVSRLVIDHNRVRHGETNGDNTYHACALKRDLLIEHDDGKEEMIPIPGNLGEDPEGEEARRYLKYVIPFQLEGLRMAYDLKMHHQPVYLIQIHSFHPIYNGVRRETDIDVLDGPGSTGSTKITKEIVSWLSHKSELNVHQNQPWGMASVSGGVFAGVLKDRGMRLLAFDINNKHLADQAGIEKIGDLLIEAIHEVITP